MKSTFFKKVCGESVIEVPLPADRFIRNLHQLSGDCRSTDTDGCELMFRCSKEGQIRIISSSYSKNCIHGTVEDNNSKTVVRFYELCDRSNVVVRWALFLLYIVLLIFDFVFDFMQFWYHAICILLIFGALLGVGLSEKRNATLDFPIMKEELMRKIEAAEKWDN